jgi:hypothetical protein
MIVGGYIVEGAIALIALAGLGWGVVNTIRHGLDGQRDERRSER